MLITWYWLLRGRRKWQWYLQAARKLCEVLVQISQAPTQVLVTDGLIAGGFQRSLCVGSHPISEG